MGSLHESEEIEYQSIKSFFDVLVDVHTNEWNKGNRSERHVVFSTADNVQGLVEWFETNNRTDAGGTVLDDLPKPLDDGGIVPHYSGKGRGGEYALSLIHGHEDPWKHAITVQDAKISPWMNAMRPTPSTVRGLVVTLLTLPFLHNNFALSAAPLPTTAEGRTTQWSIPACLGDPSHPIDMFSLSDLKFIVPFLFEHTEKYQGRAIKLSGEKITLDEVAYQFSDLFGKDVIYGKHVRYQENKLVARKY